MRQACQAHLRSYAELVAAVAALENRGIAAADGFPVRRVAQLVKQLTRLSLADCRALVKVARMTSRQPAGGSCFTETELPATAAALADGAVNPSHVRESSPRCRPCRRTGPTATASKPH
ncbi:DUF222 domain-containing protein [Fodinicola acaciae]|uniref:DUF222 domain-containing protein n=1 Tax=Fodinicola acaciae TaxID=2681555 RepID=UPI0013D0E9F7|nr:DUF222 domain-containing protein [Fodinicola acaciae]